MKQLVVSKNGIDWKKITEYALRQILAARDRLEQGGRLAHQDDEDRGRIKALRELIAAPDAEQVAPPKEATERVEGGLNY